MVGNGAYRISPTVLSAFAAIFQSYNASTLRLCGFLLFWFFLKSMLRHKKKSHLLRSLLELHSSVTSSMKCPQAWWVSITDSLASFTCWPELLFLLIYWPTEHLQQYWCTCNLLSVTKPHWDILPKALPLANNKLSQKAESFPQWKNKRQTGYPQSHYFCPWIPPKFLCCSWKNFMILQV